jgi:hypothetical protein
VQCGAVWGGWWELGVVRRRGARERDKERERQRERHRERHRERERERERGDALAGVGFDINVWC